MRNAMTNTVRPFFIVALLAIALFACYKIATAAPVPVDVEVRKSSQLALHNNLVTLTFHGPFEPTTYFRADVSGHSECNGSGMGRERSFGAGTQSPSVQHVYISDRCPPGEYTVEASYKHRGEELGSGSDSFTVRGDDTLIPVVVSPAPIPVVVSPAPIPVVVSPAPIPVVVSPAPIPVVVSPTPIPVVVSPTPTPVLVAPTASVPAPATATPRPAVTPELPPAPKLIFATPEALPPAIPPAQVAIIPPSTGDGGLIDG